MFLNVNTREIEQRFELDGPSGRGRFFRFGLPPAVALSADLGTLVQGLDDGTVQFINTQTREITTLKSPDGRVDWVDLSPDGQSLITAGRERSLRWWDLRTRTNTLLASEGRRALFSPDSRVLATFARNGAVELWDVSGHSLRTNLAIEPAQNFAGLLTSAAAFSPDSRTLATTSADDTVRLWDTTTARLIGVFTGHKQDVSSVAFSPDGRTLATASDDSTLRFWNVATQQELISIRKFGGATRDLLFSPDGRLLIGSRGLHSRTGGLRFYRAPSLEESDMANVKANAAEPSR